MSNMKYIDIKLEQGGQYLIDRIQTDYNTTILKVQSIRVTEETKAAYRIRLEDGDYVWVLKGWTVKIIEKL